MHRTLAAAATAILIASPSHAQRIQPEVRVDALGPAPYTVEPGAGLIVPLGYYVRVGMNAGFNVRRHEAFTGGSWRGDLVARVTLDPFRQQRWALSIGGGLSFRRRTYIEAIIDFEGPETRGWLTALQVGVSGGYRAGIGLRRAIAGRR
jgi:hypothetical protein